MPTPIAHPAAAIPFARVGLAFSALVVGSIASDFGYFFELPEGYFMYTVPGLILFDVPTGLVLLWLFHTLLKWPLLAASHQPARPSFQMRSGIFLWTIQTLPPDPALVASRFFDACSLGLIYP